MVLEAPGGYSLYSCELNKMDEDDCMRCEKSNIPRTNVAIMRKRLEMDTKNDILYDVFKWCILALYLVGVIFDFSSRIFIIGECVITIVCSFIKVFFIDERKEK